MASVPPIAVAVLAAGQSRRFGEADKLAAPFRGKPMGLHVCDKFGILPVAARWMVAAETNHPCADGWRAAGFDILLNPQAESGMGSSVALAARNAQAAGMTALIIALADMPLVPESHFANLMDRAGRFSIRASHNGETATPPALFGSEHFRWLAEAKGDAGARKLLHRADFIDCPAQLLVDIDDPETLARLG